MASENKTVSVRLTEDDVKFITDMGDGFNDGLRNMIAHIKFINKYADREIAGVFTESEWKMLADCLNGTLAEGDFRYVASVLSASVVDGELYDGVASRWQVDVKEVTEKITQLSCVGVEAVYRRVEQYWKGGNQTIENFAKF